jgi:hypothetical protein
MTTEILRNIMYRQADNEQNPEREDRLATVGLVVLDEVPILPLIPPHGPVLFHTAACWCSPSARPFQNACQVCALQP